MNWEKKTITIITKAYPEYSKRHGSVACTAGITDEGEWIRLYPIDMRYFVGSSKISKFDIIEVECKKDRDKLGRKENYKIRPDSITIVDKSLSKPRANWKKRNELLFPHRVYSVEELQNQYEYDKTSLGLLKPRELIDFISTESLKIYDQQRWTFFLTLDGMRIPKVTDIPHIFKYKFTCSCCKEKNYHTMQCEDWELFESYRSWGPRYQNLELLWGKIFEKFFIKMKGNKNLHFIMGSHSQYPTWFIIGLYYPPKQQFKQMRI